MTTSWTVERDRSTFSGFPAGGRALGLVALMLAARVACSATVDLKPVADTGIMEAFPANNLGAETSLACGGTASALRTRILLRFDVASVVPPDAVIRQAGLSVTVAKENFSSLDAVYELHRQQTPWAEGTGVGRTGAAAKAGEPTWSFKASPSVTWGAPGGQAGVDYDSAVSSSLPLTGTGRVTFPSSDQLTSDIQGWLSAPASNQGWILICASEGQALTARRFSSRESGALTAPVLHITYDVPPPELRVGATGFDRATSTLTLEWNSVLPPYQLQRRDSLDADWQNVGDATQETHVSIVVGGGEGYYRVVALGTP